MANSEISKKFVGSTRYSSWSSCSRPNWMLKEKARQDAAIGLRLGEAQLDLNQALKRSLIADLEREQVTYLDLTDHMKNQNYQVFWNQDYHLNDKGHWLVAEALFRYFSAASRAPSAHPATR